MKNNQFSITKIELTHDQSEQLKIDCINAIENYGIENFEIRKTEIEVPYDDDEPLKCYITCETFSIWDDEIAPNNPELLERSVHLTIQLINKEGSEVQFKVLGEKQYSENLKRFIDKTPICIEEEIIKHFTI